MYGLSEAGVVSFNDPGSPQRSKQGTAGLAAPGISLRILSSSGVPVPLPGEQGEICLKGEKVISSYWRRPDADEAGFFGTAAAGLKGFVTLSCFPVQPAVILMLQNFTRLCSFLCTESYVVLKNGKRGFTAADGAST